MESYRYFTTPTPQNKDGTGFAYRSTKEELRESAKHYEKLGYRQIIQEFYGKTILVYEPIPGFKKPTTSKS